MTPAAPVATPMAIMLRDPETMPSNHSRAPRRNAPPRSPEPRIHALSGCWVRETMIIAIDAQNAEREGESRSSMMHQMRITIGSR